MAVVTVDRSGRAPFARLRGRAENGRLASRRADITSQAVSRATRRPHHKFSKTRSTGA
jgi:hypothetical protein